MKAVDAVSSASMLFCLCLRSLAYLTVQLQRTVQIANVFISVTAYVTLATFVGYCLCMVIRARTLPPATPDAQKASRVRRRATALRNQLISICVRGPLRSRAPPRRFEVIASAISAYYSSLTDLLVQQSRFSYYPYFVSRLIIVLSASYISRNWP